MAEEQVGVRVSVKDQKKVEEILQRLERRAERTQAEATRAQQAARGLIASGGRQFLDFAARETFAFAATQILSKTLSESEAARGAGFLTTLGFAGISGAMAGASGGPAGAVIGAGVNIALTVIQKLVADAKATKEQIDKLRKRLDDFEDKVAVRFDALRIQFFEFEKKQEERLQKLREESRKESLNQNYAFAQLLVGEGE